MESRKKLINFSKIKNVNIVESGIKHHQTKQTILMRRGE
jgi:hypothetical protein